jgi:hypothetical protein
MGFLSFDKTSKNTTNNYDQSQNSTNTVGDNRVGGDNSIIGGNTSAATINGDVTNTDYGAIEQGVGLAKGSLDFASNVAANSFQLTDHATSNALLFGEDVLTANNKSNQLVADIAQGSLDNIYKGNKDFLNYASGVNDKSLDFAENISDNTNSTISSAFSKFTDGVGNAINQVSSVVKGANTSDSVQTIKYIGFAVVGIAVAVFVLPQIFKGGK